MQTKYGTVALGVLGAALMITDRVEAQTALPPITVEGNQQGQGGGGGQSAPAAQPAPAEAPATGGNPANAIDGYVAESSSTGTKTNTPLREIPQSVSVVTRDQIDDRGAQTLAESIGYSAGVAVNPYGLDSRFDQFIIRGFEQNTTGVYRDGLRLPTSSFTSFRIEPEGVDHIDIMRGPTSGLYGLNNPGGMVNVVSKMPTEEAFGEIWASFGTWEAKTVGFDVGGPAANGKVEYRVTGMMRDADTQVDFVENDRFYIAPAITFKPSEATTFTILANYQKDKTGDTFQLLPADAVRNGSIPRDTFLGEPDYSKLNGEQWGVGYQLEHKFDPAVTFRQNLRYDHASTDYQTIYPTDGDLSLDLLLGLNPLDPNAVLLAGQDADEKVGVFQVDNQLQFDSRFDRVENKLLVGFDYSHFTGENTLGFGVATRGGGAAFFQNPFNPVYGPITFVNPFTIEFSENPATSIDQKLTQETKGLYIQDQIKYDQHWVVTLGGRYDWVDSEIKDRKFDDVINNPTDTRADDSSSSNDEAFTYRVGLNYLFDNGLTPYASYSTSFFPVPLTTSAGEPLKPEEGEQIEAGIKYQPKGSKSWVLASVFDLTKQNVTQQGPGANNFFQTGEIQVKGFELEAALDFDNGWKVLGAYNYWDAEITSDASGLNIGNRPARIPEHLASLWLDYTFRTGTLKGLGLGLGVRYVGDTFGDEANDYAVPSYTLFDAAVRYEWDQWKLSLNVANLLDDYYIGTCGSVTLTGADPYEYCSYGKGRNATVRVGYRW
jgi:iron complex outermembrane receptor protein